MKFSVVTAFYNRRALFLTTLQSLAASPLKHELEVIVVDDASRAGEQIDDVPDLFDLDITVVKVRAEDKWWRNPCIPFNIGFNRARGDIVIIQNPECVHCGDILGTALRQIKPRTYLNFGCYSADEELTRRLRAVDFAASDLPARLRGVLQPLINRGTVGDGETGWYNHSKHKATRLHFCSAIRRDDLMALGGFDERYANGMAFDDNELLARIVRGGMNVQVIDSPFVVHQFHGTTHYVGNVVPYQKNEALFKNVTQHETTARVFSRYYPCLELPL
jgi:GT2 family glycosyltransferase